MLKIKDGRKHFYQWEINQKLVVGNAAKFVHYYNGIDDNALVVDVVDGFADVPNIYLTENWTIHAFAFDGEKVIGAAAFEVVPRAKPDDYVYSQTEVKTWEQLDQKIDTLVGFDLSDYYTKEEVDAAIDNVSSVDFSNYYTKKEVDSKIENIDVDVDMSNYYTKKEADAAINAAKPDLTGYALKTDIPSLDGYAKEEDIPSLTGYATESWVEGKGYLTQHQDLTGYAKTTDIPDVSGFQTEEEVNAAIVAYVGVIENGTY